MILPEVTINKTTKKKCRRENDAFHLHLITIKIVLENSNLSNVKRFANIMSDKLFLQKKKKKKKVKNACYGYTEII